MDASALGRAYCPADAAARCLRTGAGHGAPPRHDQLERIAAIFGVPLGELLARSGWADADASFGANGPPAPAPYEPLRPLLQAIDWDEEAIAKTRQCLCTLAERDRPRRTGYQSERRGLEEGSSTSAGCRQHPDT